MLTRLAELNCSIMHQSVILYLWCSSSLSPHSAVLKFGAKRDLQACKAPCELIVLYILLICNASWYRASRAPRPSERFKERREGIPFVLSVCCLLLSALAWCSLPARRAAGPVWPSLSIAAPPVACPCRLSLQCAPVHRSPASLQSWQTASSCSCFADTDAFHRAFSRKTLSRKTLLSTWQNQSSFNRKALGPLDVITCINRMTHPIFLLFVTYISLFSFSWQRADNCSCPWRWCSESNLQTFFVIVWQQTAWPCIQEQRWT